MWSLFRRIVEWAGSTFGNFGETSRSGFWNVHHEWNKMDWVRFIMSWDKNALEQGLFTLLLFTLLSRLLLLRFLLLLLVLLLLLLLLLSKLLKCTTKLSCPLTFGPIKQNMIILWLNELYIYKHFEDYGSHNLLPNQLPNSKDKQWLAPFYDCGSRHRFNMI